MDALTIFTASVAIICVGGITLIAFILGRTWQHTIDINAFRRGMHLWAQRTQADSEENNEERVN